MARLFLEFVAQRSLNFQAAVISRFPNLLITVCTVEINYNACFRAFVGSSGWCFVIFLAISLRMPVKNKFAIWGLILGPCFCRNPFLWRAIDFRFLLSRFRYFLWILEFLLLLLLCFSTSLLFCVFALLFSACMLFLLFHYFVFSCFSASLLFLLLSVLLPCFFPTCQVRVVRFYVSCLLLLSSSPLLSSPLLLLLLNRDPRSVCPAGPQPRPSTLSVPCRTSTTTSPPSVPCRTSTASIPAQCSLPDLNHDHPRPVFPAGPQPRPSPPSVPCRTSTTTIHAQCSLQDLNRMSEDMPDRMSEDMPDKMP